VGETWFRSLPDDLKTILLEESDKAGEYASRLTVKRIGEMEQELQEQGIVINEIDTSEFRTATAGVDRLFEGYSDYRREFDSILGK
jgi:TRAP-type C4-dicarboxylate transport system substrate-binding protein